MQGGVKQPQRAHLELPEAEARNIVGFSPRAFRSTVLLRMPWFDDITGSTDMSLSKLQVTAKDREAWCTAVHGLQRVRHDLATEQQSCQRLDFRLQPAL